MAQNGYPESSYITLIDGTVLHADLTILVCKAGQAENSQNKE
jgi:hypothetical protein